MSKYYVSYLQYQGKGRPDFPADAFSNRFKSENEARNFVGKNNDKKARSYQVWILFEEPIEGNTNKVIDCGMVKK